MNTAFIRRIALTMAIIAIIGLGDATYLTVTHYTGSATKCFVVHGCNIVTSSRYAVVAGVPLALLGGLYYLAVIVGAAVVFRTKKKSLADNLASLTIVGFLISLYLIYLQAFTLKAFCIYCLGSAATSTLLFAVSIIYWTRREPTVNELPHS